MMRMRKPRSPPEESAATGLLGKRRGVVAEPVSSHVRGVTVITTANELPVFFVVARSPPNWFVHKNLSRAHAVWPV